MKAEKSLTPFTTGRSEPKLTPSVLADTEKVRGEILKIRLRLSEAEQRRHTRERREQVRCDNCKHVQTGFMLTRLHLKTDPRKVNASAGLGNSVFSVVEAERCKKVVCTLRLQFLPLRLRPDWSGLHQLTALCGR